MEYLVESRITAVSVYPDRARVTSGGEVTVAPGMHQLLFSELPLSLDQESVRVTGKGTAVVLIRSVETQRRYYEQTPAGDVRALEAEIEQLKDEMAGWQDRDKTLETQGKYLAGLWQQTEQFARGLAFGRSDIARQTELVQFLQSEDERTRQGRREVAQALRELQKRLDKVQAELSQKHAAKPRQRFEARVEIEVQTAGVFLPQLSYVVNQASWQPLYDLRLDEQGKLQLTYLAQISQNSGQDWTGVALSLSTARPALNQRLPELNPWFVDVAPPPRPVPQPRMMARAASADMMMDDAVRAPLPAPAMAMAEPVMVEAQAVVASVESSGTAVTYHINGGSDIPSDGRPHKTTIATYPFTPELDYVAVPKHTDAVYRRIKVKNSSPGPLLAGKANLFAGAEYLGETQVGYTAVGDEIELLLGVEEQISVSRELVRRDVDKTFMRDKRRILYGYKISLKNLRSDAVKVTVQDHFPKSRHEQIKVEMKSCTPALAEPSELNMLEWAVNIPPQKESTIQYEYLVEYPTQLVVIGLA